MPFIANTRQQQQQMLGELGLTMDELFADIPADLRCRFFNLPEGLSEQQARQHIAGLAARNTAQAVCFLGGGFYDHYIPAAVDALASRSEFYTAYTPYQPEVSQGTLQAIYEYQSMICRLTEMEVSNASLYDGGTALCEAVAMALRTTGRDKIIVDDSVSPIYRAMLTTYFGNLKIRLTITNNHRGLANRRQILAGLDKQTAAVAVQNPNFFGCVDDFSDIAAAVHGAGAILIVSCYPISLGILKTPGSMGADIVTAEGQSLGIPLSFGGPYLGIMAARREHIRKMPGRIVGQTTDARGRRGYVLTLQAREQHIRRDKATSNICTNESLCALRALIYLCLLGKEGLPQLARLCADKAAYACERLAGLAGVSRRFTDTAFFNEFVLDLPQSAERAVSELLKQGFAAGVPLGRYYRGMENSILIAVTEKRTRQQIDALATVMERLL
jgi:glycine dehydrogenase subunit 1